MSTDAAAGIDVNEWLVNTKVIIERVKREFPLNSEGRYQSPVVRCPSGHPMVMYTPEEMAQFKGYETGYGCDNCRNGRGLTQAETGLHCLQCHVDYCLGCVFRSLDPKMYQLFKDMATITKPVTLTCSLHAHGLLFFQPPNAVSECPNCHKKQHPLAPRYICATACTLPAGYCFDCVVKHKTDNLGDDQNAVEVKEEDKDRQEAEEAAAAAVPELQEESLDAARAKAETASGEVRKQAVLLTATMKLDEVCRRCSAAVDAIVAECKKTGSKWSDPDFPNDDRALWTDPANPPDAEVIEKPAKWRRLSEFKLCGGTKSVVLFAESEDEHGEVEQGGVGDCYLMSSLSVLEARGLIRALFVKHDVATGVYGVRFFQNGEWKYVLVDDWVPCTDKGAPLFAWGTDRREIWMTIIEKAYAKLHRCFQNIDGGLDRYALQDLTGGVAGETDLRTKPDEDELWTSLMRKQKEGFLLSCAIRPDESCESEEHDGETGLLKLHAYSILSLHEPKPGLRLLKIRNPHGSGEWQGAWSDEAPEWGLEENKGVAESLGLTNEDDGTFFMKLDDFVGHFTHVGFCRLFNSNWKMFSCQGRWTPNRCGGSEDLAQNPQFNLRVLHESTTVVVSLCQPDTKPHGGNDTYPVSIGFAVCKIAFPEVGRKDILLEAPAVAERSSFMEFTLAPSKAPYVIVPYCTVKGVAMPFVLNVYANKPFELEDTAAVRVCELCHSRIKYGYHCLDCQTVDICLRCQHLVQFPANDPGWRHKKTHKLRPLKGSPPKAGFFCGMCPKTLPDASYFCVDCQQVSVCVGCNAKLKEMDEQERKKLHGDGCRQLMMRVNSGITCDCCYSFSWFGPGLVCDTCGIDCCPSCHTSKNFSGTTHQANHQVTQYPDESWPSWDKAATRVPVPKRTQPRFTLHPSQEVALAASLKLNTASRRQDTKDHVGALLPRGLPLAQSGESEFDTWFFLARRAVLTQLPEPDDIESMDCSSLPHWTMMWWGVLDVKHDDSLRVHTFTELAALPMTFGEDGGVRGTCKAMGEMRIIAGKWDGSTVNLAIGCIKKEDGENLEHAIELDLSLNHSATLFILKGTAKIFDENHDNPVETEVSFRAVMPETDAYECWKELVESSKGKEKSVSEAQGDGPDADDDDDQGEEKKKVAQEVNIVGKSSEWWGMQFCGEASSPAGLRPSRKCGPGGLNCPGCSAADVQGGVLNPFVVRLMCSGMPMRQALKVVETAAVMDDPEKGRKQYEDAARLAAMLASAKESGDGSSCQAKPVRFTPKSHKRIRYVEDAPADAAAATFKKFRPVSLPSEPGVEAPKQPAAAPEVKAEAAAPAPKVTATTKAAPSKPSAVTPAKADTVAKPAARSPAGAKPAPKAVSTPTKSASSATKVATTSPAAKKPATTASTPVKKAATGTPVKKEPVKVGTTTKAAASSTPAKPAVKAAATPTKTATTPSKTSTTLSKTAATPAKSATTPAKAAATPTKTAATPVKKAAPVATKTAATPTKTVATPTKTAATPVKKVAPAATKTPAKAPAKTATPSKTPVKAAAKPATSPVKKP